LFQEFEKLTKNINFNIFHNERVNILVIPSDLILEFKIFIVCQKTNIRKTIFSLKSKIDVHQKTAQNFQTLPYHLVILNVAAQTLHKIHKNLDSMFENWRQKHHVGIRPKWSNTQNRLEAGL